MDNGILRIGNAIVARIIAHINGIIAIFGYIEGPGRRSRFGAITVGIAIIPLCTLRPGPRLGIIAIGIFNHRGRLGITVPAHHEDITASTFEHRAHIIVHPFVGMLIFAKIHCNAALPSPTAIELNTMSRAQTDAFARERAFFERTRGQTSGLSGLSHRKPMLHRTLNRFVRFTADHIRPRQNAAFCLIILRRCIR